MSQMDFELDEDFLAPEPVAAPAEQAESAATAPNTAAGNGSPEPIASTSRQTDDLLEVRATKRPRLDLDYELDQEFGATEPEGPAKDDLSSSVQELMQSQSAQKTTMAARPAFSVSNLDLSDGRQYSSSVTATTFDGKKITFKRRPQRSIQQLSSEKSSALTAFSKRATQLLERPIHKILDEIEHERLNPPPAPVEPLTEANLARVDNRGKGKKKESEMWTDRYRPKKFTDLLGDDRMNRSAMSWLKEWDSCVFKSTDARNARKKAMAAERRKKARNDTTAGAEDNIPEDPLGRPLEKIMLLSGPPGLGKTTLAHVLARQAGYQVHEINASDDRSAKVVTDRIRDALESRALTSLGSMSDNRPTCVVIDEIDGATGGEDSGFVRTLVKFVMDGSKVPRKGAFKSKGKKENKPLIRPIICICNDLYAPVLRPLRPLARIVRFTAPAHNSLITRLRSICEGENLSTDTKSLTALVNVAEGDMRNCLNTLQFIKTKSSVVDEKIVKAATVGMKDTGTSASAVWDRLFRIPVNKKGKNQGDEKYVNRLVRDVSTCGEYDKLIQGCFENYPLCKSPTDGWKTISRALDWIAFYDQLDGNLKSERNYELYPYIPYSFVHWHPLFASHANKSVEWPKTDYEAYMKKAAHQEIAEAFTKNVPTTTRTGFSATDLIGELAPLLVRILSADVKLINGQTAKAEDRRALEKVAQIMFHFGLSFVQEKNEDGQFAYKLEPALDVFVHYDGKRAADIAPSRYSMRHTIAQQLDVLYARKASGNDEAPATAQSIYGAYKQSAIPGAGDSVVAAPVDFFGRIVPQKQDEDDDGTSQRPRKKIKVTYKFNEGFSNAVKLPIKIQELFSR